MSPSPAWWIRPLLGSVADHALAPLREALTNVGRHAAATALAVTVAAGDDLRLVVVDKGRGMGRAVRTAGA